MQRCKPAVIGARPEIKTASRIYPTSGRSADSDMMEDRLRGTLSKGERQSSTQNCYGTGLVTRVHNSRLACITEDFTLRFVLES